MARDYPKERRRAEERIIRTQLYNSLWSLAIILHHLKIVKIFDEDYIEYDSFDVGIYSHNYYEKHYKKRVDERS